MSERYLYTNRLIKEKSPYLLQHAHNPVDWYAWGSEAFEAAKELDRPIFLSIGYATCHWCHVMEKESFENLEVAQLLNETFISIKIDREELPEIDSLYMEFAQSMMAGAAGWPLNVILTPELRPFFAATYLPPHSSQGLMGLLELIQRIHEVWEGEEKERVLIQSERIVDAFQDAVHVQGIDFPPKELLEESIQLIYKLADPTNGGLRGVPKFPIGYQCTYQMSYSTICKDTRALFLAERTLDMMQRGGIYDHLGGGFSRYSIDEKWLVPHFEKMLYDNALLALAYLNAWQLTKRPFYREVCQEILDYVLRDMTHPEGGFYSAEDADSEGHEGLFYTWTPQEVEKVLGKQDATLFCDFFQITPNGNFEGRSILNTPVRIEEYAIKLGLNEKELESLLTEQKHKLWKAREKRIHPFKDDKILSSWNGLMIHVMAHAGAAFAEPRYIKASQKAAHFIRDHLWKNGHLLRRWREGTASFDAGIDEYAYLIYGVLALFEIGDGGEWLEWALEMSTILSDEFQSEGGAFYQTDGKDPFVILRKSQFSDGAEPSGNSLQCENLLRLYQLTQNPSYREQAEDVLRAVKKYLDNYPPGYTWHLMNLNRYYDRHAPTLVVALNSSQEYMEELRREIFSHYIPHKAVLWRYEDDATTFKYIPNISIQTPVNDKTTLYICREGVCQEPLTDIQEMIETIRKL